MPSSLTYYFAGVGTAGIALVAGFGGALIFSNALMKDTPPPLTRVERVAKSLSATAHSQNANIFPSKAAPVVTTPTPIDVSQQTAIAPLDFQEPATANKARQLNRPEAAPENGRLELGSMHDVAAPSHLNAAATNRSQDTPSPTRAQQDNADIATAKRLRELELKQAREFNKVDQRRNAERKQKQEITAAADAVRRMLRDRRDEDAIGRTFNLGFASDD